MIVKNEEEFLERCLDSVYRFVDEIIIVDTGSEDRTVEIAGRFTDKIYHHPWENSFSKARNQALQYASCDWIFQIDGDEEIVPGGGDQLHHAVRNAGDADIIFVTILSSYSNGAKTASHNFERVFKNNGIIHYEGDVHNRIVGGTKPLFSSVQLIHHGYDVDEEKSEAKFKRTADLLKQEISRDPHNPLYHHYLGVSYLSRNMDTESAEESEQAIKLADGQNNTNPIYLWTHFNASMAHYRMGNMEKAEFYAKKAYRKSQNHLDSLYMLTVISGEKFEWNDVISYGNRFMDLLHLYETKPEKAGLTVNNTIHEGNVICAIIGHAYYAMNNGLEMNQWYQKALDSSDEPGMMSGKIGTFHLDRTGDLRLAEFYLKLALDQTPEHHDIRYALAKYYKTAGSHSEEEECLEWLYRNGHIDPVVFNRLIHLYVEKGNLDSALEVAKEGEKHFPDDDSYLQKQAVIYRGKNKPGEAIDCYLKALENNPDLPEIWNELGCLFIEIGDMDNAQIFFEKAVSVSGDTTLSLLKLCEISIRKRSPEDIVLFLNRLIKDRAIRVSSTIEDMTGLFSALTEVASVFRSDPKYASLSGKLLTMFQNEFAASLSGDEYGAEKR